MALLTPNYEQNGSYSASSDRQVGDVLVPNYGYVGTGDFVVSRHGSGNMSVDIAPGRFWIDGRDTPGQGKYLCQSTSVYNLAIAAAPTTGGYTRIDRIVLTVRDAAVIGGLDNDFIPISIAGTAGVSPVPPALPATSTRTIGLVTVAHGATAIHTADIQSGFGTAVQSCTYTKQALVLAEHDINQGASVQNTSSLTAPHDGTYLLSVGNNVAVSGGTGHGALIVQYNLANLYALATGEVAGVAPYVQLTGAWSLDMGAGDQIRLQYQNNSSSGEGGQLQFANAAPSVFNWFELRQTAGGNY